VKRGRLIAETLIGTDLDDPEYQEYLVTELSYGLGGSNFFTGQREPRGYFLHVLPEGRGQGMRRFTMFSGLKVLVSPANRFIQSTLDRLIPDPDLVAKVQREVLTSMRTTLERRLAHARDEQRPALAERIDRLDLLLSQRS